MNAATTTRSSTASAGSNLLHAVMVVIGAVGMTLAFFLVLPILQAITTEKQPDTMLRDAPGFQQPPPDDAMQEEEQQEEPEEEEPPPEFEAESEPLDLAALELAMDTSLGGGWFDGAAMQVDLSGLMGAGGKMDSIFSATELDQKPRVVYNPGPIYDAKVRRKVPGSAVVVFEVNERGRVEDPNVLSSTDPVFDRPALNAIKKWRFEPGKRNGEPVSFRMRIEIVFPEQ